MMVDVNDSLSPNVGGMILALYFRDTLGTCLFCDDCCCWVVIDSLNNEHWSIHNEQEMIEWSGGFDSVPNVIPSC